MAIALGNAIRLKFNLARCERTAFDRNAPDENKEFDVDRIFFFWLSFLSRWQRQTMLIFDFLFVVWIVQSTPTHEPS